MNGSPLAFVDVPAILMVVLGTFAVTAISYTGEELREAQPSFRQAMFRTEIDPRVAARRVLHPRGQGAQARHAVPAGRSLRRARRAVPARSLSMLVDGLQVDEIERNMTLEAHALAQGRHRAAAILRRAAEVSPAMGLIGTLVGLVQMLGNLDSPERIGPAMSVALLTTLYGALMANVVFLPLASKLERNATVEQLVSQIYTMGVASMGRQENPRRLEMLLNTVLPAGQQIRYFD